jgi:hypothetical protein
MRRVTVIRSTCALTSLSAPLAPLDGKAVEGVGPVRLEGDREGADPFLIGPIAAAGARSAWATRLN